MLTNVVWKKCAYRDQSEVGVKDKIEIFNLLFFDQLVALMHTVVYKQYTHPFLVRDCLFFFVRNALDAGQNYL